MADPCLDLTDGLLQDAVKFPRRARCSGRTLTLLTLLIGFKLVILLSPVLRTSKEGEEHLAVQEPTIAMARLSGPSFGQTARVQAVQQLSLPSRAWQFPQSPRVSQFAEQNRFMHSVGLLQPTRSAGLRQSMQLAATAPSDSTATKPGIAEADSTAASPAAVARVKQSMEPSALSDSTATAATAATAYTHAAGSADASQAAQEEHDSHGFGKLKEVFTKYGPLALGFHFTVWSATLGTSLAALSLGPQVEEYFPAQIQALLPAGTGNLAAAYILTEATGPFRTLVTLGVAPILGKNLGPKDS